MSEMMAVKTLDVLAGEINAIKDQVRMNMVAASIEIGQRLAEAKAVCAHGEWGAWLEENVEYSERTAQNLMRIYQEYGHGANPQALAELSYSKAVALLGLPVEQREQLIDSGAVAEMSTRALQDEIVRLKREREDAAAAIDELKGAAAGQQAAANDEIERLRANTLSSMAAAKEAREALLEANNAGKQDAAQRKALEKQVKEMEARAAELSDQLAKADKPEIVQQEVIPEEMQRELEQLRELAKKAPSAEVIRLRDRFSQFTAEFQQVAELLRQVETVDSNVAAQYYVAIKNGLTRMIGSVEAQEGRWADGQAAG